MGFYYFHCPTTSTIHRDLGAALARSRPRELGRDNCTVCHPATAAPAAALLLRRPVVLALLTTVFAPSEIPLAGSHFTSDAAVRRGGRSAARSFCGAAQRRRRSGAASFCEAAQRRRGSGGGASVGWRSSGDAAAASFCGRRRGASAAATQRWRRRAAWRGAAGSSVRHCGGSGRT